MGDQLKGRESQVRIVLNKADEITAEELLKIQGNLVWNVSPLMASMEPPTLYAGSFWSKPYKSGAPKRLLKSQEMALLKDIKDAIDKRVEKRIAKDIIDNPSKYHIYEGNNKLSYILYIIL